MGIQGDLAVVVERGRRTRGFEKGGVIQVGYRRRKTDMMILYGDTRVLLRHVSSSCSYSNNSLIITFYYVNIAFLLRIKKIFLARFPSLEFHLKLY